MENTQRRVLFYGAIAIAVVALLLGVYNAIPDIYHWPVPDYAQPTKVHEKYVALFGGIAALSVVGALIARPKRNAK
jgi:hypothetical protein